MNSRYYSSTERKTISFRLILIIVIPLLIIMFAWLFLNKGQGKPEMAEKDVPITENLKIPDQNDLSKQLLENPPPSQQLPQNQGNDIESIDQQSEIGVTENTQLPDADPKEAVTLPALEHSDAVFKQDVLSLSPGFSELLNVEGIIKRWVVVINDFSQNQRPYKHFRYFKLSSPFRVETDQTGIYMAERSYQRYDFLASAVHAVDVEKAVSLLWKYRPLLQQAFSEFGYPEEYQVEDIIKKAVSNVLQAPVIESRIKLIKPSVRYKFAEKHLESLSPVQKQMIRMGPENTRIIQAKLRQFVEEMSNR